MDADGEAARKLIAGGFVAVEVETKPRKTTRKRTARKTKPQE